MRLPQTARIRSWLCTSTALVLAALLALAPTVGFAAEDEEDDFLSDDYGQEEDFADDFLEDDYVAPEEEEVKGALYWGFYVPFDVLISRPYALTDTIIGGAFLAAAAPLFGGFSAVNSAWDWAWGEGWYYDQGNLQAAMQICLQEPWEYAWDRPLGQLSSDY
jgi:hypothetical protein